MPKKLTARDFTSPPNLPLGFTPHEHVGRDTITVFPEIIAPRAGGWAIVDSLSGGATSVRHGVFIAPMTDDAFARALRRHEQFHVRWSPPSVPTSRHFSVDSIGAAEDGRVNTLALSTPLRLDNAADYPSPTPLESYAPKAIQVIAPFERCLAEGREIDGQLALDRPWLPYRVACMAVALLGWPKAWRDVYLGRAANILTRSEYSAVCDVYNKCNRLFWYTPEFARSRQAARLLERLTPKPKRRIRNFSPTRLKGSGTMHIITPDRPVLIPTNALQRRPIVSSEGHLLRAPWRAPIDGSVFTRYRRVPGGTVLVDCSASMAWDDADLRRLLTLVPAATVATYSGDGSTGYLMIVAAKGHRVTPTSPVRPRFGGNVIDLPALTWLARHPGPRVWVSDGGVTGTVDGGHAQAVIDARTIVLRSRIVRCNDADDALAWFKSKGRIGASTRLCNACANHADDDDGLSTSYVSDAGIPLPSDDASLTTSDT